MVGGRSVEFFRDYCSARKFKKINQKAKSGGNGDKGCDGNNKGGREGKFLQLTERFLQTS
jgi:hypothetical protein